MDTSPLSLSKRNILATLSGKKMRVKHGLFLVEGAKSVRDLVDYGGDKFEICYLVTQSPDLDQAKSIAELIESHRKESARNEAHNASVDIYIASEDAMKKISSLSSLPGIVAVCRLPSSESEDRFYTDPLPADLYLMLDGIQDPGNLGTIIRTAHWFGVKRIFASKDTVDIFNPKVVQASMGSLGSVEVNYVDLRRVALANPDIPIVGLLLEGKNLFHSPRLESAFLIMGNEGNGISSELRNEVSIALTIPPYSQTNHSESLNVAIATAITLAHFRQ